ncbi:unnamed protein product [Leptidea sinapis]|uniref:Uncharacterized protein n=1 Tax=Leptidea sinapis TaxID=189913 RepID=A0A5E4PZX8_9NEOP|nr:unnamed protein product [Leptidea sinapis]
MKLCLDIVQKRSEQSTIEPIVKELIDGMKKQRDRTSVANQNGKLTPSIDYKSDSIPRIDTAVYQHEYRKGFENDNNYIIADEMPLSMPADAVKELIYDIKNDRYGISLSYQHEQNTLINDDEEYVIPKRLYTEKSADISESIYNMNKERDTTSAPNQHENFGTFRGYNSHKTLDRISTTEKKPTISYDDSLVSLENFNNDATTSKINSLNDLKRKNYKQPFGTYENKRLSLLRRPQSILKAKSNDKGNEDIHNELRGHFSEESVSKSVFDVTEKNLENHLGYFFPKTQGKIQISKRHKSSSEIIKETNDMIIARNIEENRRIEESRLRKIKNDQEKRILKANKNIVENERKDNNMSHDVKLSVTSFKKRKEKGEKKMLDSTLPINVKETAKAASKDEPHLIKEKTKKGEGDLFKMNGEEKADQLKREKYEKDKLKLQKAEQLQREKEEKEKLKIKKADDLKREKEEKNKQKIQKAEQLKKEKDEKDNLAIEKADKLKREREVKEKPIIEKTDHLKRGKGEEENVKKDSKNQAINKKEELDKLKTENDDKDKQKKGKVSTSKKEEQGDVNYQSLISDQLKNKKEEEWTKRKNDDLKPTDAVKEEKHETKLKADKDNKVDDKIDKKKEIKPKNITKEDKNIPNKELDINKIQLMKDSQDDLILQLVKLKGSSAGPRVKTNPLSDVKLKKAAVIHQGHTGTKSVGCKICADSELELDIQDIMYKQLPTQKKEIIFGKKIVEGVIPTLHLESEKGSVEPMFFKTVYDEEVAPISVKFEENVKNDVQVDGTKSVSIAKGN